MKQLLMAVQVTDALILIGLILIQNKGVGLGGVFGGSDTNAFRTKRGAEKVIFRATILLSALFLISGFLSLFIK